MRLIALAIMVNLVVMAACDRDMNNASDTQSEMVANGQATTSFTAPLLREQVPEDDQRKPALIYYMADTREPFFQAAVAFEIRQLRETCIAQNSDVNWIALVNSHFVKYRRYFKCQAGKLDWVSYDIPGLDDKVAKLARPDFDLRRLDKSDAVASAFDIELMPQHEPELNVHYVEMPFIHPEVMQTILTHVFTETFPPQNYVYFLNIKAHGSRENALTSLSDVQLQHKIDSQKSKMAEKGLEFLANLPYGDAGLNMDSRLALAYQALNLGQLTPRSTQQISALETISEQFASSGLSEQFASSGLSEQFASSGLSEQFASSGLSEQFASSGLSEQFAAAGLSEQFAAAGLSEQFATAGLSEQFSAAGLSESLLIGSSSGLQAPPNEFGIKHRSHFSIIKAAVNKAYAVHGRVEASFGFVFIESCDSNVQETAANLVQYTSSLRPELKALYSSEGALWYRNIDWNNLYYEWLNSNRSAHAFQSALYGKLMQIPNIIYH